MPSDLVVRARASFLLRQSAGAAFCLLALVGGTEASQLEPQEAGQYDFKATFTSEPRGFDPDSLTSLLANDRAVVFSWVARESPGLRAYRLTTVIEGGALSGTVVRWTVEPGSGQRLDMDRLLEYRLRLPLAIETGLQLHAALEAIAADGSQFLLAERDAFPERRSEGQLGSSRGARLVQEDVGSARSAIAPGSPTAALSNPPTLALPAQAGASAGSRSRMPITGTGSPGCRGPPPRADTRRS